MDGVEFKKGAGVITSVKNELPLIAEIKNLYVVNGQRVLFKAEMYTQLYLFVI